MKYIITAILITTITLLSSQAGASECGQRNRSVPILKIKQALDIAEKYLDAYKVDTTCHFLQSIFYEESCLGTKSLAPCWQITYEKSFYADGGQLFLFVDMNGVVKSIPGI